VTKNEGENLKPPNYYQASHDACLMHFHYWATQTHTKNVTWAKEGHALN
jgi:hypothetical protein